MTAISPFGPDRSNRTKTVPRPEIKDCGNLTGKVLWGSRKKLPTGSRDLLGPTSSMIRLVLHSTDLKLRPLLAPALGEEFHVTVEADPDRLKKILLSGSVDV